MPQAYSYRDDPHVPDFDDSFPLAVMDAGCAMCSWGARMIHRLDVEQTVRICPLQTPRGAALMRHYGLCPENPASWLFIDQGVGYRNFEAVIHVGRLLGGRGRIADILRLLPRPARERLYLWVARNRYTLFGRADMCAIPDPAFRRRLLL
ncbi:MAG: hypothetical protein HLUCCO17_16540 [Saliniramus fredricksonii]|uniref:Predicted thiol-disulfide oxidoreductase YuxK, DCC family n=1 Tax=Saliniramus fredricksonii TaxID=1653334 RepID=A0A0P7XNJ7_9HYPH|nr:DCC1-like thiol-disulfide oxidoreductase family protein [Saliniramus fredricksonii]KPQ09011.1 MAG: hypothetical protein HLUCCO17_16540 [Saliniramus fredricksonii]SCC79615.1 Predicted thiol-disulfide oxidoreductase YuxK, DCC family [Saliniramus fredricksonii]